MGADILADRPEQRDDIESSSSEGVSWQNPGEFPPFKGETSSTEANEDMSRIGREAARSNAEKQYQNELTRAYESEREGITKFSIDVDGKTIDGYDFCGADFKMLVSVIGAVGQHLGLHSRGIDLEKWKNASRDYISTSLISNEKMCLFDKSGLIFGFNQLKDGDFLSSAPADHGVLMDIEKMEQYEEDVMDPDTLLEETDTRDSLTPWNEVRLNGKTIPDSIVVFGDSIEAISDEAKKAAEFFGAPIYLIRTDVYGEPTDRHDERDLSEEVVDFWKNYNNHIPERVEQEKNALQNEAESYFETGVVGEHIAKYLGDYENELQAVREKSSSKEEFVRNLIVVLGQDRLAALKEQIENNN